MEGTSVLVLSRKAGEQIVIDDHICITITAIKGDRVKVGITAPPEVQVDRAEVHQKRQDWVEVDAVI
jgi:carbon storage regulator